MRRKLAGRLGQYGSRGRHFDFGGKKQIDKGTRQVQASVHREGELIGSQQLDSPLLAKKDGERAGQRAQGVSRVEHQVVPGQCQGAALGHGGLRDDGLLQGEAGAAIAAHAVQHPQKGHQKDAGKLAGHRQAEPAQRRQQGKPGERAPPPQPIGTQADDQRAHGHASHPGGNHHADVGGGKTGAGEIDSQDDAGEPYAQRAQKGGAIDDQQVALEGWELHSPWRRAYS